MTVVSPEIGVVCGGDSTPAMATVTSKSIFRELDDAFLQTQTRIWLGEVLQVRLDEEMDISDILADGKLLSELSEVLSTMLPSLREDSAQSKTNEWKSFASSKSTQGYMPYYVVGSFLNFCKNLGLDSIDLFTPSDVVEKRNTRKVCMCMRSLSKRARSKGLNVPDFDNVTCTLTMPTNMVECIRKSLEKSQSNSSLTEVDKISRVRSKNRISISASTVSNECSSDICEDAESDLIVGEVNGPLHHNYDAENAESPSMQRSEVVVDCSSTRKLNTRNLENEENDQCEYLSPSNRESVGSPCSQYLSDQEVVIPSYDCLGSHVSGKVDFSDAKAKHQNSDFLHIPIDWDDGHLGFENHSNESTCVLQDEEDAVIHDTHIENPTHPSEIVSAKSSCTNSIALGDVDMPCEFPIEDGFDINLAENSSDSLKNTNRNRDSVDLVGQTSTFPGFDQCEASDESFPGSGAFETKKTSFDHAEEHCNHNLIDLAVCKSCAAPSSSLVDMELSRDDNLCAGNIQETCVIPQDHKPHDDAVVLNTFSTTLDDLLPGAETSLNIEDADQKCLLIVKDIEKAKVDDANDKPQHKPPKKLLKTVMKGTAVLGVAVFLLHLRKNRQENLSRVRKQPIDTMKPSAPAPTQIKSQKGVKTGSVYPAEKLKFGF